MEQSIKQQLELLAEPGFQAFQQKLLPGVGSILGVRLPKLRAIAQKLAYSDWRAYLDHAEDDTFEECMLQGMVIGYIDASVTEKLARTAVFVPKISNWSVCDSFCSGFKLPREAPDEVWQFLTPYLQSTAEFSIRFGVVMLLFYYVDAAHLQEVLTILDQIRHEGYYARMAVAWAVSVCYAVFPVETESYLHRSSLDSFTYNKALQKIIESLRVTPEDKLRIRALRRG